MDQQDGQDRTNPGERSSSILCILFIDVKFFGCGPAALYYYLRVSLRLAKTFPGASLCLRLCRRTKPTRLVPVLGLRLCRTEYSVD
jgi:hypothetical protein